MTDHSDAEKSVLKTLWDSALQYLCHFHVGQSEWRWLYNSDNGVPKGDRQSLMSILKRVSKFTSSWKEVGSTFLKNLSLIIVNPFIFLANVC